MMTRKWWLLRASALFVLLGSCGTAADRGCTLIGFSSGIRLDVSVLAEVSEFCVGDVCQTPSSEFPFIELPNDEPATHEYRIVVSFGGGPEEVLEGEVETKEYFANGEGCDPQTANATIELDSSGAVSIRHP